MSLILPTAAVVCAAILAALALLLRKLVLQGNSVPVTAEWIEGLSTSRYGPMERLLDEEDFRYLASQPGLDPKVCRALRTQRRRIFRDYLRCLCRDYNRVCFGIRLLMLQSDQDRPDLAEVLLRQRLAFTLGLLRVEFRLALHAVGLGTVDVSGLVGAFDSLRLEFNQMAMTAAPSAA